MILVELSLGTRDGALVAAAQRETGGVFQNGNRFSTMASSQVLILINITLGLWIDDKERRTYQ